jgi:hypothetical protein
MRRRWIRKSAKWTCTIAAAVVVGAAVFCLFRSVQFWYRPQNTRTVVMVRLVGGRLEVYKWEISRGYSQGDRYEWRVEDPGAWSWGMYYEEGSGRVWRGGIRPFVYGGPMALSGGGVTLLYPFLLTAIPAGLLWWKDLRRFGPGRCRKCGYDRAGLTAATTCPECGTPPAPATK